MPTKTFFQQNKTEAARYRKFAVSEIQSGSRFSKEAFKGYKAAGGTLTLKQIQAKKPTTKRKG